MLRVVIVFVLVVALTGVVGFSAINQKNSAPAKPSEFSMVQKDIDSGAKLYDVRTDEEYTDGHFEDADLWSLQDIQAAKLPDVAKDTKLYVYCRSGNRSAQAASLLSDAGYTNVVDLGGLQDVQASGAPQCC